MVDLFLLCVAAMGTPIVRSSGQPGESSKAVIGKGRAFLAENAWQEVEVWVLIGHELLPITPARKFRMLLILTRRASEGNARDPRSRFGLVYDLLCCRGNNQQDAPGKSLPTVNSNDPRKDVQWDDPLPVAWSKSKYSVNPYLIEHNLININQLWRRSISALWMMVRRNRKEINELRLEATG